MTRSNYNLKEQPRQSNSSFSYTNQNVKERSSLVKYEKEKDGKKESSLAGSSSKTTNNKDKGSSLSFPLNYLNGLVFSLSSK